MGRFSVARSFAAQPGSFHLLGGQKAYLSPVVLLMISASGQSQQDCGLDSDVHSDFEADSELCLDIVLPMLSPPEQVSLESAHDGWIACA
jgi:hypothetical protein